MLRFSKPVRLQHRRGRAPETRSGHDFGVESTLKRSVDGSKIRISGTPVPYNVLSRVLVDGKRERYAPGCFARSLNDPELSINIGHDPEKPLGSVGTGTATFTETATGLTCCVTLPPTTDANDLRVRMEMGLVASMSAGFYILKSYEETLSSGQKVRIIEEGKLVECSLVCKAAYPAATAAIDEDYAQLSDDDDILDYPDMMAIAASAPSTGIARRSARPGERQAEFDSLNARIRILRAR
jgi:HK97 family phage prohead protease